MNRVNVMLHIIPSGVKPDDLEDYNPVRDGKVLSNPNEIKVNKVHDGYSIIYNTEMFKRLDQGLFSFNVKRLFETNLPGTGVDIGIFYHCDVDDDDVEFDVSAAEKMFELERYFIANKTDTFLYHRTRSIVKVYDYYQEIDEPDDQFEKLFGFDPFDDDDDDEDIDPNDPFAYMMRSHGKGKSKKNNSFDSYGRSRVLKNAKNPKRAYHRHGVLVARDKDDLRKDEKILKAFLKEFIPGNSDWRKDLRRDVLDRWMRMYALSKKNINRLEREYRKSNDGKRRKAEAEKALDFTRKLFNVPIDRWNDPTK